MVHDDLQYREKWKENFQQLYQKAGTDTGDAVLYP